MQKKKVIYSPARAAAVICEIDPFHFGHKALFDWTKEKYGGLVCILSGNFTQRGEPALLDKWARAKLALENGADLVIELPLSWACSGAERFASGGVALAAAFPWVDALAFGSEFPDASLLLKIAEALLSPEFSRCLAELPDRGESFARRREQAAAALLGREVLPVMRAPNAILGIEYCKAILRQGAKLSPMAFPRLGAGHGREASGGELRSAGELRELVRKREAVGGLVPKTTAELLRAETVLGRCPGDIRLLEKAILCKLRTMILEDFSDLPDISEGIENRLFRASRQASSLEELYSLVKSKRVSHARVRRLVLSAFLDLSGEVPELPPYLRVIGMTGRGEALLRQESLALPLAVRPADFKRLGGEALVLFEQEQRADDLYALACPVPYPCGRDCRERLLRL